ncbi:ABC transporter ATP-binding protein [Helicobacter marmotae]|uniref:ABC transporter ATP-binding protein n=1 Tax=Helicobacter marmotae TaxID=152490 RepID=A0A3D8I729_9HELI|nr:ABC transporter ATP-binding protein [Helicobacter marmotae]RDU60963.1 ABC transporter ATP-binding protein [Helicobacter marmotae]
MTSHKRGIARLLELSKQKATMLILAGIFSGLSAILQFVPYFASYLIVCEFVINAHDLSAVDRDYVLLCGLSAILAVVASMVFVGVSFTLSHFAAYRILYNIRLALLGHLSSLPLGYFTATTKGEIHKNVQENVEKIENFIAHKIPEFLMTLIGAIAIFAVFIWADWRFGCICIGVYIFALFVQFSIYTKGSMKEEIKRFFSHQEQMNARSIEFVDGMSLFKLFNKSAFSFANLASSIYAYRDYTLSFAYKCMPTFAVFNLLINCFIFFILPLSAFLVAEEPLDIMLVLTIVFFVMMSNGLIAPLLKIMNLSSEVMQINEGVARIDTIFAQKPLKIAANPIAPKHFDITFEHVSFEYENGREVLSDVSFSLKEGEHLVIVGESGSGKSTLLTLLARFYDVKSGRILIGGVDIRNMSEEGLLGCLSLVFQDSFLFMDTLRENIKAGCKEASDEQILQAARLAQADEIVQKYSLDCPIGERLGSDGVKLSGGEAQRINIARALLKDSPILLLDEITSSLDTYNENAINKALKALITSSKKSIIMVAHKLGSVKYAHKVALMDKGRLLAFGTHRELLESCSEYKHLWELHTRAQSWSIENK